MGRRANGCRFVQASQLHNFSGICPRRSRYDHLSRSEFVTTETELNAMAMAA